MSSDEIHELEKELRQLKSAPRALTITGRDGKIIAIVREEQGEVKPGMIVLFSFPPEKAEMEVRLVEYQVRQNPKTQKYYIKCFRWVEETTVQRTVEELEKKVEELRKIEEEQRRQELREKNLQTLQQLGLGEEALRLLEAEQWDAFATIVAKDSKAVAVMWDDEGEFIVLLPQKSLSISYENDEIIIEEVALPVYFEPERWITTKDKEIIAVDMEFDAASVIASKYGRSFLLLPKAVAERVNIIVQSKLDPEMKKQLLEEVVK